MKSEQRLLLALGIAMGISLFWTAFFPPLQESGGGSPQQPLPARTVLQRQLSQEKQVSEIIESCRVGSILLGVGSRLGGIQTAGVDGASLTVEGNPSIFQVDSLDPAVGFLRFENRCQDGCLVSQTHLEEGLSVTREILPASDEHNFLLKLKFQAKNESAEKRKCHLRLVIYRPLSSLDPADRRYQDGFISLGGKVQHLRPRRGQKLDSPLSPEWVTTQGKSHLLILKPSRSFGSFHVEQSEDGTPVGWLDLSPEELAPGEEKNWDFSFYAGPMELSLLKAVGFEEEVSFGTFSGIAKFLLGVLNLVYLWCHNYGGAIVSLSFGIWLLFFPITWSGVRMMKVMAKIQPQIERLRQEHKKNPKKLNEEVLKLYRKHRVNPLSGCLPLFLQMPIFIALYQILSRSPQLRGASFLWIQDLAAPDALIRFSHPLPVLGSSLNLLPILMSLGMFFQQQMNRSSQVALTEEQQIQQNLFRWFPLFFGFLFYKLPSGLVLYWVSNTVLTIGQQIIYLRMDKS